MFGLHTGSTSVILLINEVGDIAIRQQNGPTSNKLACVLALPKQLTQVRGIHQAQFFSLVFANNILPLAFLCMYSCSLTIQIFCYIVQSNYSIFFVVGCVVELRVESTLGPVLPIIVVAATKRTMRRRQSVQNETYTDTRIIIIVTRLIQILLSRNPD